MRKPKNRLRAIFAGIGVVRRLQSSTTTGLLVTGFAAGSLVDLAPALAVMLGANTVLPYSALCWPALSPQIARAVDKATVGRSLRYGEKTMSSISSKPRSSAI